MKPEPDLDPELLDQLRAFTALDNPVRLKAFLIIHDRPGISFNELASILDVETGLAAYHVGVLKAADLVDVSYARSGRVTSSYRISERGEAIRELLFAGRKEGGPRPFHVKSSSRRRGLLAGPIR